MINKLLLVKLFNCKKLKIEDANWLLAQGFAVICNDGKVTDVVPDV